MAAIELNSHHQVPQLSACNISLSPAHEVDSKLIDLDPLNSPVPHFPASLQPSMPWSQPQLFSLPTLPHEHPRRIRRESIVSAMLPSLLSPWQDHPDYGIIHTSGCDICSSYTTHMAEANRSDGQPSYQMAIRDRANRHHAEYHNGINEGRRQQRSDDRRLLDDSERHRTERDHAIQSLDRSRIECNAAREQLVASAKRIDAAISDYNLLRSRIDELETFLRAMQVQEGESSPRDDMSRASRNRESLAGRKSDLRPLPKEPTVSPCTTSSHSVLGQGAHDSNPASEGTVVASSVHADRESGSPDLPATRNMQEGDKKRQDSILQTFDCRNGEPILSSVDITGGLLPELTDYVIPSSVPSPPDPAVEMRGERENHAVACPPISPLVTSSSSATVASASYSSISITGVTPVEPPVATPARNRVHRNPKTIRELRSLMNAAQKPDSFAALTKVRALVKEAQRTPREQRTDVDRYLLLNWRSPQDSGDSTAVPYQAKPTPRSDDSVEVWYSFLCTHSGSWPLGIRRDANRKPYMSDLMAYRLAASLRPEIHTAMNPSAKRLFMTLVTQLFAVPGGYEECLRKNGFEISDEERLAPYPYPISDSDITTVDIARHFATCGVTKMIANQQLEPWARSRQKATQAIDRSRTNASQEDGVSLDPPAPILPYLTLPINMHHASA